MHNFQIGQLYNRSRDIHDRFGGSRQSGISPCKESPFVFLFTGSQGEQYGYQDHWDDAGLFHYTGEGQNGDMTFDKGNKAIRDHQIDGRDILLFEQLGKSKPYRFLGEFVCTSYEIKKIPDKAGNSRDGIVFHLLNVDEEQIDSQPLENPMNQTDFSSLRERAYQAARSAPQVKSREGKVNYYERHQAIKDYVLNRAQGHCECCGAPAPFLKKDGSPYLEPHHILKLSDKGLDHPAMVAAITPNCHREIHYGVNGKEIDQKLLKHISQKERTLELPKVS
jgi:5-methylcytosine-specific restriction protein A